METAFASWIGRPVVVHIALGRIKLSLRGMVLKEQTDTLLLRAHYGPYVKIVKTTVLAIEEASARSAQAQLTPFEDKGMRKIEILRMSLGPPTQLGNWVLSAYPIDEAARQTRPQEYQRG